MAKKIISNEQLLAPNGKPSNLNATQYALVRSKSFKNWFGDWEKTPSKASKVVDENGEPLVVYHGSNQEFNIFDSTKIGGRTKYPTDGFYFDIEEKYATDYGQYVYPCFLNIKTPLKVDFEGGYYKGYKYDINKLVAFVKEGNSDWYGNKYDGVKANNIIDTPTDRNTTSTTYVAFKSNQIKLADGTNTTFDKKNPDIRFEQGGEIKIDKILSSSSRFKPSEIIVFDPPLIGTNGNKLISYEWKYDWESRTSREGDEYGKRISDWTQAEESAETGRDLVHIYTIELKDKSIKNVSSESVLILLGLVEKEQKKIFGNIATASKTLAKQQMKLAILEAQKKQYDEAKETLEKAEKPPIKIAKFDELPIVIKRVIERKGSTNEIYFVMGDVNAPQDLPYSKLINFRDYDNISISQYPPTKNTIENLESRWLFKRLNELNLKYPSDLYNLKNRVERQTKKVENMIKVDSFEKGGFIPTNKKVGWGIFGFVVGIITLGTINSK